MEVVIPNNIWRMWDTFDINLILFNLFNLIWFDLIYLIAVTNDCIVYLIYRFIQGRLRDLYFQYVMQGTAASQPVRQDTPWCVMRLDDIYLFDI